MQPPTPNAIDQAENGGDSGVALSTIEYVNPSLESG